MIALALIGMIALVAILSSGVGGAIAWKQGKKTKTREVSKTAGLLTSLMALVCLSVFVSFLISYFFDGLNWVIGGETTFAMYVEAMAFLALRSLTVAVPFVCFCFFFSACRAGNTQ
ncbi:hypothetical protein [Ruegeria meonggei]|uniref:Uncharacterized protein n=1 Tax=Ruegeria meonggei TaxID=1446476 RepID=A0A1X6ZUS1_9RHOB|nr:hypothetical protein [Ruegeria meonggei]SLN62201.1 hypothetical protein RUM8411_03052 [Ruegeria meonggei]